MNYLLCYEETIEEEKGQWSCDFDLEVERRSGRSGLAYGVEWICDKIVGSAASSIYRLPLQNYHDGTISIRKPIKAYNGPVENP